MDNSRATSSVARDSTGKNLMYLPPNSNYSMSGIEGYVNRCNDTERTFPTRDTRIE
jgi:hypothetical protein